MYLNIHIHTHMRVTLKKIFLIFTCSFLLRANFSSLYTVTFFPPLSSVCFFSLGSGSAGVGASVAGLRCSLSWAGWGDGEERMRKGMEWGRCTIHNPEEPIKKNRRHMYSGKLNKQIKTKTTALSLTRLSSTHPSPLFHSFFPSFSWDRPGRAWPERHLLHNVMGQNSKSFISTHCLSTVCMCALTQFHMHSWTERVCSVCEISFYGCCDISVSTDDVERKGWWNEKVMPSFCGFERWLLHSWILVIILVVIVIIIISQWNRGQRCGITGMLPFRWNKPFDWNHL